ncbi:ABC-F family ATP-binding cassette domain-containing protein [Flavicella sediminum]|uniref:ABC-F family ATP-binding cassette domain-containing protein n=1 Tax=Flavicella sediminum TaxID=2585141 RepID=UPI00111E96CE|nr:ABC-F family ATP-binding cassette domain-containing protein [Flavicella sediminum]
MNYLSVENISKAYGERVLFDNISFGINKGQKVAFVAKNGTGKTSILNIITGRDTSDTGQVVMRKDLHMAYLAQNDEFDPNLTIEEVVFSSDNPTLKVIQEYEKAIENPEDADAYQRAFELMDQYDAWDFESQYKQILTKLKFEDIHLKVGKLSGGQRKRLGLATVLINKPDLLILDEPTNHLDLEMIEWLEAFFKKEKMTLFMVTHDRYFLERVCNEIIELDGGELYRYKGSYSYYLEKKEERIALEQVVQEKAKNLFKKELDWMRRQPKARTTKSKSRIDDFFEIKEKAHNRRIEHKVQLEISMERLGSKILEMHKVSKSWGDLKILDNFEYVFKRGERIGIIGKNGTGKSSFLNLITHKEPVDQGKVILGETVKYGYYTQNGIQAKEGQKVIEVIKEFGEYIPLAKGNKISASQLLERFLFDRKRQYDFVEKLSGGERKRLFLCAVLIQNPNFLILDEPTNDLDIVTLNVLENFLLDFPGNLIVVSHDRYFMDKIVDSLFVFRGHGEIENFPGNYSDFRAYEDSKPKEGGQKKEVIRAIEKPVEKAKKKGQLTYNEKREWGTLESDIAKLERKKETIEGQFANGEVADDKINEVSVKLQKTIEELEQKEERWFELSAKLEGE